MDRHFSLWGGKYLTTRDVLTIDYYTIFLLYYLLLLLQLYHVKTNCRLLRRLKFEICKSIFELFWWGADVCEPIYLYTVYSVLYSVYTYLQYIYYRLGIFIVCTMHCGSMYTTLIYVYLLYQFVCFISIKQ